MELTIAICVYNAEKFISDTLKCIIRQSNQDFKLLIINDYSTDNSINIAKKILNENQRQYNIIESTENKGIAYARNIALTEADTKYLLFVDADDLLDPFLAEKLYNVAVSDQNIMGVTCWSQFIDLNGRKIVGGTYLGVKSYPEFYNKAAAGKLFFMPIHTLFDRDMALRSGGFATVGFPEGKPRFQDYCEELDLWTRMSDLYTEGKYFTTIPEPLYLYRKNNGISSDHFNMILKMRYTKHNVRQRRAGKPESTFIEYYSSLTDKELKNLRREAFAADSLRNGAILLKHGHIFKGPWLILRSIIAKPSYFFDKIKNNL